MVKDKDIWGGHENNLRSGTLNVPGIIGFAAATEVIKEKDIKRMERLRDILIDGLLKIPNSSLNGPSGDKRLCNNVNVLFKYIEGESVLLHLDFKGIYVSTGSACSSHNLSQNHVIKAIGVDPRIANGALRITIGIETTEDDIKYVLAEVGPIVEKLTKMSPLSKSSRR
jgi:cysteine desulfurase